MTGHHPDDYPPVLLPGGYQIHVELETVNMDDGDGESGPRLDLQTIAVEIKVIECPTKNVVMHGVWQHDGEYDWTDVRELPHGDRTEIIEYLHHELGVM